MKLHGVRLTTPCSPALLPAKNKPSPANRQRAAQACNQGHSRPATPQLSAGTSCWSGHGGRANWDADARWPKQARWLKQPRAAPIAGGWGVAGPGPVLGLPAIRCTPGRGDGRGDGRGNGPRGLHTPRAGALVGCMWVWWKARARPAAGVPRSGPGALHTPRGQGDVRVCVVGGVGMGGGKARRRRRLLGLALASYGM